MKHLERFGINKEIPPDYRLAVLTSLAYFPELKDIKIRFLIRNNTIFPYAARPDWRTMFEAKEKWAYQIIINHESQIYDKLLLKNLPFRAQVGILGHEISHISWYIRQNRWTILLTGLKYFWKSFRRNFERETDKITIRHGLGWELYEYAVYIRALENFDKKFRWINNYYLHPDEIKKTIEEVAESKLT